MYNECTSTLRYALGSSALLVFVFCCCAVVGVACLAAARLVLPK